MRPVSVKSTNCFWYYVIFVDCFTRFTGFCLLKENFNFFSWFVYFYKFIEYQFDKKKEKKKKFQCDKRGEFGGNELNRCVNFNLQSYLYLFLYQFN